jgi:hypothetical protein
MNSYDATTGDLQVQLQAGLQYNTKAIALNKKKPAKTSTQKAPETKSTCYHSYGGCHKTTEAQTSKQQGNSWTLRLQPSAGLGYIPSGKGDLETTNSASYQYNAGNLSTEFITGLGFELAKNKNPFITLAINYFKGLGTNETVLLTESGGKPVSTSLRSKLSGWNAAIGIPISLAKKSKTTTVATKKENNSPHRCTEYYRSRCGSYKRVQ